MCVCALAIASRVWRGINGAYVYPPFAYASAPLLLDFIQRQSTSIFVGERARRYVCDVTYCAVRRFKHDMCSHYRSIHKHKFSLTLSFSNHSQRERERERERSGVGMYCVAFKARCVYTLSFHSRSLSLSHTYAQKSVYLWVYEGQKEREREWASNVHTDSRDDNFIRYLDFFPTHKKLKAATYEWRWADSIKTISKSVLLILPLSEAST